MKIIGTSDVLKDIRQSRSLSSENSLVFQYPFMISKSLDKQWSNILRDFFSLQFLSQIKINNVLKTIVNAIPSKVVINSKGINPAERLQQSLSKISNTEEIRPNIAQAAQNFYSHKDDQQLLTYQHQIDEFRKFIYHQLKIDPLYRNLRPAFSNVTLANNIQMPLILGTKKYDIPDTVLYWIIFIAIGQNLRLDNPSDFTKISRFLKEIPADRYMEFLYMSKIPMQKRASSFESRNLTSYINSVNSQVDKFLRHFHIFLNERQWSQEVGIGTTDLDDDISGSSITSTAFDLTQSSVISLNRRASSLFSGFISQDIIPLLSSAINAIISNVEVDVVDKLDYFTDSIVSSTPSYYDDIMNHLKSGLSGLSRSQHSLDTADDLIKIAKEMCKDNSNVDVSRVFDKLHNLYFGVTGSSFDLATFVEHIELESAKLSSHTKTLISNLRHISLESPGLDKLFESRIVFFRQSLNTLFLSKSGNDPSIFHDFSTRFKELTSGQGSPKQFIKLIISSVSEILHFLSLYCFFSYMCEYLHEVHATVQVQKRDAIDFPNFILVLPSYILESIYFVLASRNFSSLFSKDISMDKFAEFKMTEDKVNRIIGALNSRLHIPNIVVVDERSRRIFYKWMYFKSNKAIAQLDFVSVENYIKHQTEVLRIY